MELDNHKKRDKIKKYFTNSSSDNFEIDFLKKGIKNTKKDMKSF